MVGILAKIGGGGITLGGGRRRLKGRGGEHKGKRRGVGKGCYSGENVCRAGKVDFGLKRTLVWGAANMSGSEREGK